MVGIQDTQARSGNPSVSGQNRSFVAIRFGGRRVGLYRVKRVGEVGLLLNHGGISFPVGTRLVVEDVQHLLPHPGPGHLSATVVDNTSQGLRLVWCEEKSGAVLWLA